MVRNLEPNMSVCIVCGRTAGQRVCDWCGWYGWDHVVIIEDGGTRRAYLDRQKVQELFHEPWAVTMLAAGVARVSRAAMDVIARESAVVTYLA